MVHIRWKSGMIRITYEKSDGVRGNAKFVSYKCPQSNTVRLRKVELDYYFIRN